MLTHVHYGETLCCCKLGIMGGVVELVEKEKGEELGCSDPGGHSNRPRSDPWWRIRLTLQRISMVHGGAAGSDCRQSTWARGYCEHSASSPQTLQRCGFIQGRHTSLVWQSDAAAGQTRSCERPQPQTLIAGVQRHSGPVQW
jgi:hypothetical protein